jgi:hypothetical protein
MKNILKVAALAVVFLLSACEATELDLLTNPNEVTPENADLNLLFNNAVLDFVDFADEASDETMPYVRMRAMSGGEIYQNQDSPQSFDFIWEQAYEDLFPDLDLIIEIATEEGFTVHSGAAKIMKAYVMYTMVDLFGNVPFSEAGKGVEIPSPAADDGASIYAAANTLLDEAIKDLQNPVGRPANDLYYEGDASQWLKLANTLRLRAAVQTRLVEPGAATSTINGIIAEGNYISSSEDDFEFPYSSNRLNPDSRHPFYANNYENGASGYMNNWYMYLMFGEKSTVDPRIRFYFYRQDGDVTDEDQFTLDCLEQIKPPHFPDEVPFCVASEDGYWGRDHGNADGIPPDDVKRTIWGPYPAAGSFDDNSFRPDGNSLGSAGGRGAGIQPIMLASWVDFMLAETALTLGTDGDPRAYLESGVRKSIEKTISFSKSVVDVPAEFDPSQEDIDAYVNEVLALYDAATSDDERLQVIMKEYLLALYGNGLDAYNSYRRTGKPDDMQPTRDPNPGAFARSFWYPADYVNLNQNASQKSNLETQVFWDTNPPGFIQ